MKQSQVVSAQVGRLFAAIKTGLGVHGMLRLDESNAGHRVIIPGDVSWLPAEDWDPTIVVSIEDERIVRLVAILARNPGTGSFRRLIEAITAAGLIPCVICPTREMRATLKRWRWRERARGVGWEREERWFPRRQ